MAAPLTDMNDESKTLFVSDIPERPAVLLVDDDPRNLLALESFLDGGDYDLVKAQTGDEALLALMDGEFAAIVLDVQMPEVNGIELARLIKQRRRTSHVPIIFLTAYYREEEHAMLAYDAGAVDYLTKPINPTVLRSKIHVFVDLFRKTRALAQLNDRLEAQNILLQREAQERSRRLEAEAANAAKDRFLAILSHELRTPLTPILYAVDLLAKDAACPAHMRDACDIIQRNIQLEVRLIDDLLDLARIRNGKLALRTQDADALDILREAIRICSDDITRRRIHLVEQHEAASTALHADPARLQQVFWNLIANATKFTPEGGEISVRTVNEGDALIVEIRDTGIGIEPQRLESIFDAFAQGGRGSSAGLGLGLAICKALVELHGGVISAQSDGPGTGAVFTVRVPVATAAASSPPPIQPQLEATGRTHAARLLVVEDHRDTAETLQRLLSRRGYEVRIAGTIADALQMAAHYPFDILVSDIGLPDGRGTELLQRLRERSPEPIRAIAMSGFGMDEDRETSRRVGFAEHLTKPVEFGALQAAISRLAGEVFATR
jgi:signal transduction histidine kinase